MEWIFLSPHFDDVALSCGGWVWKLAHTGQAASIWTVCAGEADPTALSPFAQALHGRWGISPGAAASRREEDMCSCDRLGAAYRYFPIPDCIYRGGREPLYPSEESLWGELHPAESSLVKMLSAVLLQELPQEAGLVCPLALGHHVDHQLTRRAAEAAGRPLWYYADYPYALQAAAELEGLKQAGWQAIQFPVTEPGLQAWVEAVACHASQISTFWAGLEEMQQAIRDYSSSQGGVELWRDNHRTRI